MGRHGVARDFQTGTSQAIDEARTEGDACTGAKARGYSLKDQAKEYMEARSARLKGLNVTIRILVSFSQALTAGT